MFSWYLYYTSKLCYYRYAWVIVIIVLWCISAFNTLIFVQLKYLNGTILLLTASLIRAQRRRNLLISASDVIVIRVFVLVIVVATFFWYHIWVLMYRYIGITSFVILFLFWTSPLYGHASIFSRQKYHTSIPYIASAFIVLFHGLYGRNLFYMFARQSHLEYWASL